MTMVLFNPTNEIMETQYIGETVKIDPGVKLRVDDARGRHVANALGARGLVTLEYGDEGAGEDRKRQEGIERNLAFKRKQVHDFNMLNQQRFQGKLPYLTPPLHIREYSKELGIGISEPYKIEDETAKEIAALKNRLVEKTQDNTKKEKELDSLKAELSEIKQMMKGILKAAGKELPPEASEIINELDNLDLRKLHEKNMHEWLIANWAIIEKSPTEVKDRIAKRYEVLFKELMPTKKAEIEKKLEKKTVAA